MKLGSKILIAFVPGILVPVVARAPADILIAVFRLKETPESTMLDVLQEFRVGAFFTLLAVGFMTTFHLRAISKEEVRNWLSLITWGYAMVFLVSGGVLTCAQNFSSHIQ